MAQAQSVGVQIYRRLLGYSTQYKHYLFYAIIGLILGASTQAMFAGGMEPLLDQAIMKQDPETIAWLPMGILFIFLLRGTSTFIANYYMGLVGRRITQHIRDDVFVHMLRLPVHYFEQQTSGKMVSYLIYHTEQVAVAATRGLTVLVQETVTIIGLLAVMFYHSWQLTLGVLVIVPVIALVVAYVTKRIRRISHHVQNSVGEVTQVSNEMINGYKVVRIFNGEPFEEQRFRTVNAENMRLQMKRLVTDLLTTPIVQFLVAIALAAIIWLATRESTLASLTPGSFMAFVMAMILLLTPIRNLTQLNSQLQTAIAAGEAIFSLLDEPTEQNKGKKVLEQCQGEVSFNQVSFSYIGAEQPIVKEVSFTAQAGQKIALVGRSGSGKSTLLSLLTRFYDPQAGSILIDGHNTQDLTLQNLRSHMAYVGQDIVLFNDTVRNNIAYARRAHASDEAVMQAIEAAYAREFIEKLPQGLDTVIGDNGVLLSGGQRQRLAIARAILADAPILILDEATSALDTESERHIQAALDQLAQNRTTFTIAHRLSTIENADMIIVMADGQVVESGSHAELLAKRGHYAHLHDLQFHEEG